MSDNPVRNSPRQGLQGWRIKPKCSIGLLLLAAGIPVSAWLPVEWPGIVVALNVLGAFAAGMLLASVGAFWQPAEQSPLLGATSFDGLITDWQLQVSVVRIVLVVLVGGIVGSAWIPQDFHILRTLMYLCGTVSAGILAAKDAAIWEKTTNE